MKRTLFNSFSAAASLLAALFVSASLTSCGGDDEESKKSLAVAQTSVSLDYQGSAQLIDVTANGVSWTATPSDSWIHLTPASGNSSASVIVTADENPDKTSRVSTITFSADGVNNAVVIVLQAEGKGSSSSEDGNLDMSKDNTVEAKYIEFDYYGQYFSSYGCENDIVILQMLTKEVENNSIELPYGQISLALTIPYTGSVDKATQYFFNTFTGVSGVPSDSYQLASDASGYIYVYGEGDSDYESYTLSSGSVTIGTDNSSNVTVKATLKMKAGGTLTVTASIPASQVGLADGTSGGDDDDPTTTLTGDVAPVLTESTSAALYDSDDNTYTEALLYLRGVNASGNYDRLLLYAIAEAGASNQKVEGTYNVISLDATSVKAGDLIPGYFYYNQSDGYTYFIGSWYLEQTAEPKTVNYAALASGSVTVTKVDSQYSFTYSFADENGNKIEGTCTTALSFKVNPSTSSLRALNGPSPLKNAYMVSMPETVRHKSVARVCPELMNLR